MKKMRAQEKRKSKKKSWKKGQSCVSNPDTKKHRDAAKNRFFRVVSGPSSLTEDALLKHNALEHNDDNPEEDISDAKSAHTFSTWATNWTDCTNVTFKKVHRYVSSNSAAHKSILAVLAAITEVIKSSGGKETDTEYFGALMTALDNTDNDDDTVSAVTHLLAICIKRVPATVLRSKFSEVSKLLLNILASHIESSSPSILTSTIKCLTQLMRVQEQSAWSVASTLHVYNSLLTFTIHGKPKVRKAGQQAVISILRTSEWMVGDTAPSHHPASTTTVKYCIQQIESCGGSGEATITMHTLGLLQEILDILPKSAVKSTCETVLKVMTLANVMVTSVAMKCLHKMFVSRPKAASLSPELNAQIITALYDFKPGDHDAQLMCAWLSVMKEAHANLANLKQDLFISHVPRYFTIAMHCLKTGNQDIAKVATKSLKSLVHDNMVDSVADKFGEMIRQSTSNTSIHKIFKSVENGLGYQYHACWEHVLELLAVVFEVWGKQCHPIMAKCLQSLSDLRDSHKFPHKVLLDKAVGMAVRSMGPEILLKAIPLQITGEVDNPDFPHSWILPVLRENIRETRLSFFTNYFLPMAAKLRTRGLEHSNEGHQVEAKTYDALQLQIWSLLPGFCTKPTDLTQSFKGLAKILGTGLRDREDIRMDIMTSLRKLINQNLEDDANRAELAKFGKNYLPLLFNLYTTNPEKEQEPARMAVLETIKTYAKITDQQQIGSYVDMCLGKLSEADITQFRSHALLDLLICMTQYTNVERLQKIYEYAGSQLKSNDRTMQKKSYRILEVICSSESTDCKRIIASHLEELQENLFASLSSSSPSSKAPRLRCLIHIFKHLDEESMNFLQAVTPEAVLCTKETAEKARGAAYVLLVEMAQALLRWNPQTPKAAVIQMYFEMVLAGLAGQPHVIACTLHALTHITFQFKDYISDELLGVLIESTCLLMESNAREIVHSALAFLKVLLGVFDEATIGQFLEKIVSSLVHMKEAHKQQLRFKSKEVFTRLLRKFGYNVIISLVPPTHHKILSHIKKTQERAKRQKATKEADSDDEEEQTPKSKPERFEEYLADSDSDMDLDDGASKEQGRRKGKKSEKRAKQGATWLREGSDSVTDFLDPSVSQKVMSSKPKAEVASKRKSEETPFKVASDGRMIIHEEKDDHDDRKGKDDPIIDDLDELLDAFEGAGKKPSKRKMPVADQDVDDDEPSSKYKAGGRGIHRPVKERREPGAEYKSKKARGDMKRKGKPDPYAYIPLELSTLNRRKQAKVKGQFKNFVKGAKKGAMKGKKMRGKQKR